MSDYIFIPSELKIKEKKDISKEPFSKILSLEIIFYKKHVFAVPLDMWFNGSLKEHANDSLKISRNLYNFLKKKQEEKILNNDQKGMRDNSEKIWTL